MKVSAQEKAARKANLVENVKRNAERYRLAAKAGNKELMAEFKRKDDINAKTISEIDALELEA